MEIVIGVASLVVAVIGVYFAWRQGKNQHQGQEAQPQQPESVAKSNPPSMPFIHAGSIEGDLNVAGRDIRQETHMYVAKQEKEFGKPNFRWGLYVDGTGFGDNFDVEDRVPVCYTIHSLKRGIKNLRFTFSLHNKGNAPATELEATIHFPLNPMWELIRDKTYSENLSFTEKWDLRVIGKGYLYWTFRGQGMRLLPGRSLPLGPFVGTVGQLGNHDFLIECEALSAEGRVKLYKPKIVICNAGGFLDTGLKG